MTDTHLCMRSDMRAQGRLPSKGLVAGSTGEGSLPGVGNQVRLEVRLVGKALVAKVALVHRLACRRPTQRATN